MIGASPGAVHVANSVRGALRAAWPARARDRVANLLALSAAPVFAIATGVGLNAVLVLARRVAPQVPDLDVAVLLELALRGGFRLTALLLALGALTTAVSTLFLSEDLHARLPLPIAHRSLVAGRFARTILAAAAPAILLAVPAGFVAARWSPRPALAAAVLFLGFFATVVLAGSAGAAGAIGLVRLFPPRRAFLLAGLLSTLGLAASLVGARSARPERLLDPIAALDLLLSLSRQLPAPPPFDPFAKAARLATRALLGDAGSLGGAALLAGGALLVAALLARALAPLHLAVLRRALEDSGSSPAARDRREAGSLFGELLVAERQTLFRDAATPAQLGSLAAVIVLDLLNVRLLPSTDPAARDLVMGLQTALALFLVSALSLRFAYPAVSSDGRASLVLRALPLDAKRHLVARWVVRAAPASGLALLLVVASGVALSTPTEVVSAAALLALAGGLAIPALHLALGALFPKYGAPNAVAVALGPGGLVALVASTALAALAALPVSAELRGLLGLALGLRPRAAALLVVWLAAALGSAALAMRAASRSLETADLSGG